MKQILQLPNFVTSLSDRLIMNSIYILTLVSAMTFTNNATAQCGVTIQMNDSYGDGWNGGFLEIFFDGISQGTYSAAGTGSTANLSIPAGQTMTVNYTSGSWEGENTYTISIGGSVVFSDGTNPSTGLVYNYDCPSGGGGGGSGSNCDVVIQMNDSWGDGWNGGFLEIFFDGVSQGTYSAAGTGSTANLSIPSGQTMTVNYTSGSWEGENTYTISIGGTLEFSDGTNPSTGMVYSYDCSGGGGGCPDTEVVLNMNDSWGDGWNGANLTLTGDNGTSFGPYTIISGGSGTETICLPDDCYSVNITGGSFPGEVSWNLTENGTIISSGGAPAALSGAFSIGSANCAPPCPIPTNDLCDNAPLLDLSNNNNQTYSGTGCGSTATLGTAQEVWVAFEVPCGGMDVTIDFCGSSPVHDNSYLNVFNDCSFATFTQANTWDFTTCSDGNISLFWNGLPEGVYYFPIYIDAAWQTDFVLNISGTPTGVIATAPTGIAGNNNICAGESTTLTIQGGSPGTSGTPEWFSGTCGSGIIGTGNSINISPIVTTTYFVRYNGNCNTTNCASVTINVDQPITAPVLSGGSTICYGENVTLTGAGGNAPPANWTWYENTVNGPQLGNGSSATVSPSNTTDYVVEVAGNGGCPPAVSNTITVTLPTPDNTISGNNAQTTCRVAQNGYVHFLDPNGKLIASINSNGQNLGQVSATSYVEGTPLQVQDCSGSILTSVLDRHWVITPEFQPNGPVEVVLPLTPAEEQSLVQEANSNNNPNDDLAGLGNIVLTKYAGPSNIDNSFPNNCSGQGGNETFDLFTQTASGFVSNYWPTYSGQDLYTSFTINSFSEFWLHGTNNNSSLPVTMNYFNVECDKDAAIIHWETASEQNSSHFELQRSRDGQNWEIIHNVIAAGNTNSTSNYSYYDMNSGNGINYYRLVQVDFDGQNETYGPVSSQCESKENSITVYPNPSDNDFVVVLNSLSDSNAANIELIDLNGRVVISRSMQITTGQNSVHFKNTQLDPGSYIVKASGTSETYAHRILIIQ